MDNRTRRAWLAQVGLPVGDETKCPIPMCGECATQCGRTGLPTHQRFSDTLEKSLVTSSTTHTLTIIKNELPKDALEADRKLSRLQNFVLDAAGPLAAAYDALMSEEEPDPDKIVQHIRLSLQILRNTSTQFSHERRVKAISWLNPDLRLLVEDEDFLGAAPFLFSSSFEKKANQSGEVPKKGH